MPSSDCKRLGLTVLLLAAFVALGCVSSQRREMLESREAYQRCVERHPESHERECSGLQTEAVTRQQRYEDDARRSWGCHGSDPGCDPRDRTSRSP